MTLRTTVRGAVAALAACVVVTGLASCNPVEQAARTPEVRTSASVGAAQQTPEARASPSDGTSAPTPPRSAACSADVDLAARVARLGATPVSRPTDRVAFDAAVSASAGRVLRLGATTVGFDDFLPGDATIDGGVLGAPAGGLVGAGADQTTVEVAPHTSTRVRDIPSTFPDTNQLDVLRVPASASVLQGFTVQGTDQGHLYNGLRVAKVDDLAASDIRVVGIPGDDKQPPGETFGINDFKTDGSHWSHIEVDGAGVGGSGFGVNSSKDITICDTVSKDNAAAMGFAFWQTSGITCIDCTATDNGFSGFNFERVSGTVRLVRPTASGNRYGMRIASDRGSANYTIVDPTLTDGHWTVTLPKRWYGAANRQRASDIVLIVDGRRRPDLLRIATY